MLEIMKRIKAFSKRGYASADEKAKLAADVAKLKQEEQEAVGEDVGEVNDLPESNPETNTGDENDEEVEKSIKALFDKHGNRIEEKVKADVTAFLKEQSELNAKKAGVYHPDVQAKRKELSEYLRELSGALIGGNEAKLKEMTTGSSGSPYAGYTVDAELSAEIRHLITEYGVARREMFGVQLTKNSYKANNLTTDVTVYWVDEAGSIKSTQAVLGQGSLELKKLAVIVTLTSELLEDTEIDFISFLASRVAEGFAQAEDEAFFNGDGTSAYGSFTGLLQNTSVNEVTMTGTTFASVDADDFIDMVDATPAGALANAKFYMHRKIMSYVRKLKDSNNMYIYQAPSDKGPATVWGYPVVLVEAMPSTTAADTSFVLFGDLRKACLFGYKGAIKAARFNAGTVRNVADAADINLITTDREAVRWTERVGYLAIIPSAVTKLTTAAASA